MPPCTRRPLTGLNQQFKLSGVSENLFLNDVNQRLPGDQRVASVKSLSHIMARTFDSIIAKSDRVTMFTDKYIVQFEPGSTLTHLKIRTMKTKSYNMQKI